MHEHVDVTLAADNDGYVSQECPACQRRFKIVPGEGSDQPVSFCPYCHHQGRDCWWTPEQAEYLAGVAGEHVIGPQLDKMARQFNQGGSGGFIRMSMNVTKPRTPARPVEPNEVLPVFHFGCCNERIKHDGREPQLACIICGTLTDIGSS